MQSSSYTMLRRTCLICMFALIGVMAPQAWAQNAGASRALTAQRAADRAAIRNFPLSMDVMQRLAAAVEAGNREHLPCMNANPADLRSLDSMAHKLAAKDPRAVPLLARYGFTPRQFITATLALANTAMAAEMTSHPGSPIAQAITKGHRYNAGNVAFFNAHRTDIMSLMKRMDAGSSCGK